MLGSALKVPPPMGLGRSSRLVGDERGALELGDQKGAEAARAGNERTVRIEAGSATWKAEMLWPCRATR